MEIQELKIRNFRPFFGEQELTLSAVGGNALTLIYAENMRGKTALLNAIRWCLYGHAINRLGESVPIYRAGGGDCLLNKVAMSQGLFQMSVEMSFLHQKKKFDLRRSVAATKVPSGDEDFLMQRFLQINNESVAQDEIPSTISTVLHEEISRFSLFDGEMLTAYERLLTDDRKEIEAVKEAIEKTLGLPALTHSRIYLDDIKSEFEKALNVQLRREKKNEETVSRIEEIDDTVEAGKGELAQFKEMRSRSIQEKADAAKDLQQQEEISRTIAQVSEIENEITTADREIDESEKTIQETLHTLWWLPLRQKIRELRAEMQGRLKEDVEAKNSDLIRRYLEKSLNDNRCFLCGTRTGKSVGARIREKLHQLGLGSHSTGENGYNGRLTEHFEFLERLETDRAAERLIQIDRRLMNRQAFRTDKLGKVRSLREGLGNYSKGDHESKMRRYTEADDSVRELDSKIFSLQGKIGELERERDQEQKKLERASGADIATKESARIARLLCQSFENAIETFRNRAREVVSASANEIFMELISEKKFQGLRINNNYGLTIIDSKGQDLSGRSAGAEQIVALSLIGGLNRTAAAGNSPVVMDTNFGRLDKQHRENVLKWVSQLQRQVILLVHSGEMEEGDINQFGIEFARAYRINKVDEWTSNIEKLDSGIRA